jgi:hypothetical protein
MCKAGLIARLLFLARHTVYKGRQFREIMIHPNVRLEDQDHWRGRLRHLARYG